MEQGLHASQRRETSVRSLGVYPDSAVFPIRSAAEPGTKLELIGVGDGLQHPGDLAG
jgi:hypothetical protein